MQLCRCFIFTSWFGPLQWKPRTFDTTATTGYCSSDDKPGSSTGFYETRWFPYAPPKFNMEAENDGFQKKKLLFRFHVKLQGCSSKRPTVTLLPPILRALSEDVPHAPAYPEAMKRAFAYGFGASPNHGEGGSQGQSVTW